jgi:hypothetical protein
VSSYPSQPHKYNVLIAIWYHVFKAKVLHGHRHPLSTCSSYSEPSPFIPIPSFHFANTNETVPYIYLAVAFQGMLGCAQKQEGMAHITTHFLSPLVCCPAAFPLLLPLRPNPKDL